MKVGKVTYIMLHFELRQLGPGTALPWGCAANKGGLGMGRDPSTNASERKYPEFIGEGWTISPAYNSQFSSNHQLGMA